MPSNHTPQRTRESKTPKKKRNSPCNPLLAGWLRAQKIPEPIEEYLFHPNRQWRMDYAWPDCKIAIEIEGSKLGKNGTLHGRHVSPVGYHNDMIKYNHAAALGWRVFRIPYINNDGKGPMIQRGVAILLQWVINGIEPTETEIETMNKAINPFKEKADRAKALKKLKAKVG